MEFRILGPLEACDADGRKISLGGPKQRALLAILLTRANQAVSRDILIDELWGDDPPATAANVLQGYISDLRKALGPNTILTRSPGYLVVVESRGLDLHRFERLAEEARQAPPERAAELLREALALWRGPALADVAYEPFAQAEIARLDELRLIAIERRIEADLAVGRQAEVVPELEALVKKHPLRERLRAHLMLGLYRSGRQADALEAYQDARQALVEGLGIEPGPALREVERAILQQDRSLDAGAEQHPKAAPADSEVVYPERSILVVPSTLSRLEALVALAAPLARKPPRELILAALVEDDTELTQASASLDATRRALLAQGVPARAAAFTTGDRAGDLVALGSEQDVDLLLVDAPAGLLGDGPFEPEAATVLDGMPCDVGMVAVREAAISISPASPVLVPFGGAEHEWAAVELGAWLASVHGTALRLLGTIADPARGRRDASRLLARAALLVQRVAGVPTEPFLVPPGDGPVLEAAEGAGVLLVGLSPRWRTEGLGGVRLSLVRRATPPVVLVRRGLRPGGIAPRESLTRFTWTMAAAGQ